MGTRVESRDGQGWGVEGTNTAQEMGDPRGCSPPHPPVPFLLSPNLPDCLLLPALHLADGSWIPALGCRVPSWCCFASLQSDPGRPLSFTPAPSQLLPPCPGPQGPQTFPTWCEGGPYSAHCQLRSLIRTGGDSWGPGPACSQGPLSFPACFCSLENLIWKKISCCGRSRRKALVRRRHEAPAMLSGDPPTESTAAPELQGQEGRDQGARSAVQGCHRLAASASSAVL